MKLILTLMILLSLQFGRAAEENSELHSLEAMIGIVLLNQGRSVVDYSKVMRSGPKGKFMDAVISDLTSSYQNLTIDERVEFAFYAIAYTELDAGYSLLFRRLVQNETTEIRDRATAITDEALGERFGLTRSKIANFRKYIDRLSGDSSPSTNTEQDVGLKRVSR